jgi:predicted RND superfamily exporter protein
MGDAAVNILIRYRRLLVGLVILLTVVLALFIPRLTGDPTLKSAIDKSSDAYAQYLKFAELFGNDEFVLIAIKNKTTADQPEVLTKLNEITTALERIDKVSGVVSLSNLKMFREQKGRFGASPLVFLVDGRPSLLREEELERIRAALPLMNFLLSGDWKTVGIFVRINDQYRFDIPIIQTLLKEIDKTVRAGLPQGSEYRIVGPPAIIAAIQRYNIQTAFVFGFLCLVIGTSVSVYIFKSLKVAGITFVVIGASVIWILGFMSLTGIPLTSTTALSFGLVLIVSVATIIRIVTHFNERYPLINDRLEATRQALHIVFLPCLMCSTTTAVGFGTTMVTSIPMVFDLGLVMFLGVLFSFLMAIILTPAFLIVIKPLKQRAYEKMSRDWMAVALNKVEKLVFSHYKAVSAVGIAFTALMLAGVPLILIDTQLLRMLSTSTKEVKDIQFVEQHLSPVHALELMVEAEDGTFKRPEVWKKVADLEERLKRNPEVVSIDSCLSLLDYLDGLFNGSGRSREDLFANPRLIPELLVLVSLSHEGKMITGRYLDDNRSRLHITVGIRNSPTVSVSQTIEEVRSEAASAMKGVGKVTVTGEIAVFAAQASLLVRSQLISLVLAFIIITLLMMIHLGSPVVGLISLIPNIPPVAAVFGVMGWGGINLDTVTVFAATVALGLAVDDTIHFLHVLKNEIRSKSSGASVESCVRTAFDTTAKAMVSTSVVLFFGFLVLVISPFKPVISFGILGATAILIANLGDVIFMPAVILSSRTIRNYLGRKMAEA